MSRTLHEKSPNTYEVNLRIQSEYGKKRTRKNSVFGHLSHSGIYVNKYIPEYQSKDTPWYECDGLFTYIDQLKYEEFILNPDECFGKAEITNFDIVNQRC